MVLHLVIKRPVQSTKSYHSNNHYHHNHYWTVDYHKNLNNSTHDFDCNYPIYNGGGAYYIGKQSRLTVSSEVTNETRVQHEGQCTALSAGSVEPLFDAESVNRSIFNCSDGPLDVLGTSIS